VLDLATVVGRRFIADTYHESLENARYAGSLGYTRYGFAGHHTMIAVASSARSLLFGNIAGNTKKIKVGSDAKVSTVTIRSRQLDKGEKLNKGHYNFP